MAVCHVVNGCLWRHKWLCVMSQMVMCHVANYRFICARPLAQLLNYDNPLLPLHSHLFFVCLRSLPQWPWEQQLRCVMMLHNGWVTCMAPHPVCYSFITTTALLVYYDYRITCLLRLPHYSFITTTALQMNHEYNRYTHSKVRDVSQMAASCRKCRSHPCHITCATPQLRLPPLLLYWIESKERVVSQRAASCSK